VRGERRRRERVEKIKKEKEKNRIWNKEREEE
jgi:hypothetical protein